MAKSKRHIKRRMKLNSKIAHENRQKNYIKIRIGTYMSPKGLDLIKEKGLSKKLIEQKYKKVRYKLIPKRFDINRKLIKNEENN